MSRTLRIATHLARTAALEDRIQLLVRKYSQVPEAQIHEMAQVDPSGPRGTYLEWMVRLTQKGNIRWPEDGGRVRRALVGFNELKKKPSYFKKYKASPDINTYTLHTLEALYRQIHGAVPEKVEQDSSLPAGSSLFYQDSTFKVIKIGGPGTEMKEAARAACYFGEGTSWCTADASVAETYLERGPLFVIFKNSKKIAQTDGDQLTDVDDNPIPTRGDEGLWKLLLKLGVVSRGKWIFDYTSEVDEGRQYALEPEILDDPTYRHAYLKKFVHESWTAAAPYILRDGNIGEIYLYAIRCLNGKRWPEGERKLLSFPVGTEYLASYLEAYANAVIRERWPEAEPVILQGPPYVILDYTEKAFSGRRWSEAEQALMDRAEMGSRDSIYYLARYAVEVMKGRWTEAEPLIVREGVSLRLYTEGLGLNPREFIDEFIRTHGPAKRSS